MHLLCTRDVTITITTTIKTITVLLPSLPRILVVVFKKTKISEMDDP